ncbi:MAG: hypothetical protein O3C69_03495 [Chloroflexi bacterium]|nr:hypothetical protein [Chloroflexota bacterium]
MEQARLDNLPGLCRGIHMRRLHAHHAAVQVLVDGGRIVHLWPYERRDAMKLRRHNQRANIVRGDRAVLGVQHHPVEPQLADHLDDLRRRELDRNAECRLARADQALHPVFSHISPFVSGCRAVAAVWLSRGPAVARE